MTMKAVTDDKDQYNDGYTHEALHSAHICVSMWDEFVTDTRCADQYPDIKDAAEKVGRAMADVYQMLGMKFTDEPHGEDERS
jgi:hypothetical protein